MKIYIVQNTGVEHNEIIGIYISKKIAYRDLDFIGQQENKSVICDKTFQERWVKIGRCWYHQTRHRSKNEKWPEWCNIKAHGRLTGTLHVVEYTVQDHELQEVVDAVKQWQKRGDVHQLTCGKDSNHPPLIPYYCTYPIKGIGLKCKQKDCDWKQSPDHPILGLIHASYIRNGSPPPKTGRLRPVRKA